MFVCHGLGKVCFKSHVSNRQESQISSSYVESSQSQTMCTACHPYKVSGIRGLMGQDKYLRSVCRRMRRRREEGSFVGDGSLHYSDYDDVSQLCSNAETHSVEVISVCGTLPARPGMSKKPEAGQQCFKRIGRGVLPLHHNTASGSNYSSSSHWASQASPALVLTHSDLINPGEEGCRPGKKLAHSPST